MSFIDSSLTSTSGPIGTGLSPDFPTVADAGASSGGIFSGINAGGALGAAAAGGGLLYDLLQGDQPTPAQQNLTALGTQLGGEGTSLVSEGQGLQSYLEQGTLPPAQQAALELKQNAAKAALVQGAASKGQNATPQGNSGLTQDINSLNLQTLATQGTLEEQLFTAGTGLINAGQGFLNTDVNVQDTLAKLDAQQQADTTAAIMGFAKALGGIIAA
jgi:hypothetical protein